MRRLWAVPWKLVMLVAVFVVALGGVGVAGHSSYDDDVITACADRHNGKLRVIDKWESCKRNEQRLVWNQEGPQGTSAVPRVRRVR